MFCKVDGCTLIFPYYSRETTDFYSIAASPNFGNLRGISGAFYPDGSSQNSSDISGKTPLLSEYKNINQKGEVDRISARQSSWLEKSSVYRQLTGELPIGQGCSLTQTVFNGRHILHILYKNNWRLFKVCIRPWFV